jgi:hypothetical protein
MFNPILAFPLIDSSLVLRVCWVVALGWRPTDSPWACALKPVGQAERARPSAVCFSPNAFLRCVTTPLRTGAVIRSLTHSISLCVCLLPSEQYCWTLPNQNEAFLKRMVDRQNFGKNEVADFCTRSPALSPAAGSTMSSCVVRFDGCVNRA